MGVDTFRLFPSNSHILNLRKTCFLKMTFWYPVMRKVWNRPDSLASQPAQSTRSRYTSTPTHC